MTNKIQKYNAEKQKNSAKISELQSRNRELDRLITEAENTEISSHAKREYQFGGLCDHHQGVPRQKRSAFNYADTGGT